MGAIGGVCFSSGRSENDLTILPGASYQIPRFIGDRSKFGDVTSSYFSICFLHATLALRHSFNVLFSAYIVISH